MEEETKKKLWKAREHIKKAQLIIEDTGDDKTVSDYEDKWIELAYQGIVHAELQIKKSMNAVD